VAITVGTHSGTFHADDVLAFALIRTFVDPEATVVRTRDADVLGRCDVVIDVGGVFDPSALRFDHHQATYDGPRSSAGMVLDWLERSGRIDAELARTLRGRVVDYIDAVDTGREPPRMDVPCLARVVEYMGHGLDTPADQHAAFLDASDIARRVVGGVVRGHETTVRARTWVLQAMNAAAAAGRSVIELPQFLPWKDVYFEQGGESHPTWFVLFPQEATWKVVAIPPRNGEFSQKRSLPASWGGKMGEELEAATGVRGATFCHKNRFIAVFTTREGALDALERAGLLRWRAEGESDVSTAARAASVASPLTHR
jgi:uncharacterized UPF0160 family protein